MLQDLEYGRLENEFRNQPPMAEDIVICFQNQQILLKQGSEDVFPTFEEVSALAENWTNWYEQGFRYVFRMQEQNYFLWLGDLAEGEYGDYRYRMAVCHVPLTYVGSKGYFRDFNMAATELLNEMEIDICLSGHKHVMWPMLPGMVEPYVNPTYSVGFKGAEGKTDGGYLTDHNFPAFLVGRRSNSLTGSTQSNGYTEYTCLFTDADLATGRQVSNYVNAKGEILTGYWPFADGTYSDILTELKR